MSELTVGELFTAVGAAEADYFEAEKRVAHVEAYRAWRSRLPWRLMPRQLRVRRRRDGSTAGFYQRYGAEFERRFVLAWRAAYRRRRGLAEDSADLSASVSGRGIDVSRFRRAQRLAQELEVLLRAAAREDGLSDVRLAAAEVLHAWGEISRLVPRASWASCLCAKLRGRRSARPSRSARRGGLSRADHWDPFVAKVSAEPDLPARARADLEARCIPLLMTRRAAGAES